MYSDAQNVKNNMGWKSTKQITRKEAITLIISRAMDASNQELALALENLGYGEDLELPHYGCNFNVVDQLSEEDGEIFDS